MPPPFALLQVQEVQGDKFKWLSCDYGLKWCFYLRNVLFEGELSAMIVVSGIQVNTHCLEAIHGDCLLSSEFFPCV